MDESENLLSSMVSAAGLHGTHPRKIWTYLIDWLLVLAFIVAFAIFGSISGYQRLFSLTDTSIQYTYAVSERVPTWLLVVVAVIAPGVIIILWTLLIPPYATHPRIANSRHNRITAADTTQHPTRRKQWPMSQRLWDLNFSLLGLGVSIGAAIFITNVVKNTVGRPRPDLIDRCQPKAGSSNAEPFGLATTLVCTQTNLLKDGFKSFPSGHSSMSFSGLGYLSLFLAGRLHVLDHHGQVYKPILVVVPLLGAALIAISRTMDNRHHAGDVIVGSGLGMLVAWMAYRQYFPALASMRAGQAYALQQLDDESSGVMLGNRQNKATTSTRRNDEELENVV